MADTNTASTADPVPPSGIVTPLGGLLRHVSLQRKLAVVVLVTTVAALTIAATAFAVYDASVSRSRSADHLATVADLVAATIAPALQTARPDRVEPYLEALARDTHVQAAVAYGGDGRPLATWSRGDASVYLAPELPDTEVLAAAPTSATRIFRPIVADGRQVGVLLIESTGPGGMATLVNYLTVIVAIIIFALLVTLGLLRPLQGIVSRPILDVVRAARRISDDDDFSVRMQKHGQDEVGELVDAFNLVLERVEEHGRQLKAARDAADAASRAKTAFLVNMTHELRTPLNGIIGYAEMLCEEAADRGRDDLIPDLERIRHAAGDLLGLINNVLDLSKIEAGRMELNVEEFNLRGLITKVVDGVQPMAAANHNRISVSVNDDLMRLVMRSDPTKLGQCLRNLLSNACKFTERGTIHVIAKRRDESILIHVADTGIGMTAVQLDRVFDEFVQAEASTSRRYGGSGLGLAISRRLCRQMGGDISAESRPGAGSTFTIRLPLTIPVPATEPAGVVRMAS
ncbi:MAG TPA: ATP-binding protein [Vicinamibacterales bacterium]|nr:ATP-binding protein [Vicinamibacterales bacterium]